MQFVIICSKNFQYNDMFQNQIYIKTRCKQRYSTLGDRQSFQNGREWIFQQFTLRQNGTCVPLRVFQRHPRVFPDTVE